MGPAVVAWRPLLYIFRWNVNLLYYCTQCNGSNIWPQAFFSFFFSSLLFVVRKTNTPPGSVVHSWVFTFLGKRKMHEIWFFFFFFFLVLNLILKLFFSASRGKCVPNVFTVGCCGRTVGWGVRGEACLYALIYLCACVCVCVQQHVTWLLRVNWTYWRSMSTQHSPPPPPPTYWLTDWLKVCYSWL